MIILFVQAICFSQRKMDSFVSVNLGSSHYIGDLAPFQKQLKNIYLQSSLSLSFGYTKYITDGLFLEGRATVNKIFSDDNILNSNATELSDLRAFTRGLHFKNNLIGFNIIGGYSPFHSKRHFLSPYFATGLSIFYSNPEAKVNGNWVALMPLNLNRSITGSPKDYRKVNFGIPIVVGIPLYKKNQIGIYFETNITISMGDYLDDIGETPLQPSLYSSTELMIYDRSQEQISAYSGINRTNIVNEYNKQRFNIPYQENPFSTKIKDFGGLGDVRGDRYDRDMFYSFQIKVIYKINNNSELRCPRIR